MSTQTIASSVQDPETVLQNFVNELDHFIQNSVSTLKDVKNQHVRMGDYWKGEQYERFTCFIDQSLTATNKELVKLLEIEKQLKVKVKILEEARKK